MAAETMPSFLDDSGHFESVDDDYKYVDVKGGSRPVKRCKHCGSTGGTQELEPCHALACKLVHLNALRGKSHVEMYAPTDSPPPLATVLPDQPPPLAAVSRAGRITSITRPPPVPPSCTVSGCARYAHVVESNADGDDVVLCYDHADPPSTEGLPRVLRPLWQSPAGLAPPLLEGSISASEIVKQKTERITAKHGAHCSKCQVRFWLYYIVGDEFISVEDDGRRRFTYPSFSENPEMQKEFRKAYLALQLHRVRCDGSGNW